MDPLFKAVFRADLKELKTRIESGAKCDIRGEFEMTLLHAAVAINEVEIVKFLLHQDGISVNAQCAEKKTPLLLACESDCIDIEIPKILLQSGADPNISSVSGETPLHAACRNVHVDLARLLLDNNANVNAPDNKGRTALHSVALSNSQGTLHTLVNEVNANASAQ